MFKLFNDNCLNVLKKLPDNSIDHIITDPPYGISFFNHDWDKALPSVEIWKECLRILKPGSFMLVFSIPRQDCLYRMIKNIEESGFNINFSSLYHVFHTGLPKAVNVGKTLERQQNLDLQWGEIKSIHRERKENTIFGEERNFGSMFSKEPQVIKEWIPQTELSKKFKNAYLGFNPKPSLENIIVAMKEKEEKTYIKQCQKNNKGITWFDNCLIPHSEKIINCNREPVQGDAWNSETCGYKRDNPQYGSPNPQGRFPSHLIISDKAIENYKYYDLEAWFYNKYSNLEEYCEFNYVDIPKAVSSERNKICSNDHPCLKPIKLMSYLINLISMENDWILDPFMGSGTTGISCRLTKRKFIGIELSKKYFDIAKERIEKWQIGVS